MLYSVLLLTWISASQASERSVDGISPFLLSPQGVDYLGWLTPKECVEQLRCDVVVVDPRTGRLYVEQSDDLNGSRIYHDGIWGLSHRIEYEMEESLVQAVTDHWTMSLTYEYNNRNLTQIEWSDGRKVDVVYDRKGRVISMSDGEQHQLSFAWGRDGHHRMVNQEGRSTNWVVSNDNETVKTTDAWGMTATVLYDESNLKGWIDPRGMETRLVYKNDDLEIDHAGLRKWNVKIDGAYISQINFAGSGVLSWTYDDRGRLTEIRDASDRTVKALYINQQSTRIQRYNGFIDFAYDASGYLQEIKDISGRLIAIERDVHGQITQIDDAVGESFLFERDVVGLLKRFTLRDGRQWVIERDVEGRIRNLILPNQEVWGFQRDGWGNITKLERSHDPDFDFTVYNGVWSSIKVPNGDKWTIRRDSYQRILEVMTPQGNIQIERDMLGQIELVRIQKKTWSVDRDVFGNIVRWNDVGIERGPWDSIVSHQLEGTKWLWIRDGVGRLVAVDAQDRIDIEYDGLGYPMTWKLANATSTVKRNHWGWVSQIDEQWLQHDPRGMVERSGIHDLTWRWNRNAAGFPLAIKGPYDIQMGLSPSGSDGIERIRFPSGVFQSFRWTINGLSQWHTNSEGQERFVSTLPRDGWDPYYFRNHGVSSYGSSDHVGIHTLEREQDIQIIDYDAFYFVQQVCDLASCVHFTYDPRGHLSGIEDGTGLPTNIVWGWNGWTDAPLLIGGSIGFHTPMGMNVQSAGIEQIEHTFWYGEKGKDSTSPSADSFMDAARFETGRFHLLGSSLTLDGQDAYLDQLSSPLQRGAPWRSDTMEANLYLDMAERSVWNRPLDILLDLSLLELPKWSSPSDPSPLEWLSDAWLSSPSQWKWSVRSLPINEASFEQWLIMELLDGKPDPSNNDVLFHLLTDPELQSVITGEFPFSSNKCISTLAQFYSCG
jgi:hypothetical protein